METKRCGRCKLAKPLKDFGKWSASPDGLKKTCRPCRSTEGKTYYQGRVVADVDGAFREQRNRSARALSPARRHKRSVDYQAARATDPVRFLLRSAKKRAADRGLTFSLSASDIVIPERCPVLGLVLRLANGFAGPESPSLDRIVPALGYVRGNVRVISWRANNLRRDATLEEMEAIVMDLRALAAAQSPPTVISSNDLP